MKKLVVIFCLMFLITCVKAQVRITNTLEYPLKGKVKEAIVYNIQSAYIKKDTISSQKRILLFDKSGNPTEELDYYRDGKVVQFKSVFSYVNNNTLSEKKFDNKGKLFMTCIYKFDNNNHLIVEVPSYTSERSLVKSLAYKYDKAGNRIKEETKGVDNNIIEQIDLSYNSNNQVLQENMHSKFRNGKTVYTYVAGGSVVVKKIYNEEGVVYDQLTTATIYKGDDKYGNWTFMLQNGKPYLFRKITYYK